jgi:hypothetical protein
MGGAMKACPVCHEKIDEGYPVLWRYHVNGVLTEFSVDVCLVDSVLCEIFPSLKMALSKSETVSQMLKWVGYDG